MPAEWRAAMTRAQRPQRLFTVDVETCSECGGGAKVIARIEDPVVTQKIPDHLGKYTLADLTPYRNQLMAALDAG